MEGYLAMAEHYFQAYWTGMDADVAENQSITTLEKDLICSIHSNYIPHMEGKEPTDIQGEDTRQEANNQSSTGRCHTKDIA